MSKNIHKLNSFLAGQRFALAFALAAASVNNFTSLLDFLQYL